MKYAIFLLYFMCGWIGSSAFASDEHENNDDPSVSASEVNDHNDDHEQGKHNDTADDHEKDRHDISPPTPRANDHEGETASLHFSEQRLRDFGLETHIASSGTISQQITLPGEVQLNRERLAHINPRFPAKVTKVLARTGDQVSSGQVLAVAESSNTLAQFELTSLIEGTVTNSHITLGEVLDTSDTAFVVADLSTLWVEVDLYPKHIAQVAVGQTAMITTPHSLDPTTSTVSYVAPLVEEQTRTGLARVLINNKQGLWKPGMFITAIITLNESQVNLALPLTAVIEIDSKSIVFVQKGEEWEPRSITLGRQDSKYVEVLSGLKVGERYVAKGGFILKAQLQKGAFDNGHNH